MSTQVNFKKGSIEMLILQVLSAKGDCYGYQISQIIKNLSDGELDFPVGSLYPALYKLIEAGYITDYKQQSGKRLIRVYYHIEQNGLDRLNHLVTEYNRTSQCIQLILNHDFSEDGVE